MPESDQDLAKSVLLSDRYINAAGLDEASRRIKAGEPIEYDPNEIESWVAYLEANPDRLKMPLGCRIAVWTPIILMFVLFGLLVLLLVWIKIGMR